MKFLCHRLLALGALGMLLSGCASWVRVDPDESRGYSGYEDFPFFGSSIYGTDDDYYHRHHDDGGHNHSHSSLHSSSDRSSGSVKHGDHNHSSAEKRDQHESMDRRSSDNDRRDSSDDRRSSSNDSGRSDSGKSDSGKSDSGGSKSDNDDKGSSRSGR